MEEGWALREEGLLGFLAAALGGFKLCLYLFCLERLFLLPFFLSLSLHFRFLISPPLFLTSMDSSE